MKRLSMNTLLLITNTCVYNHLTSAFMCTTLPKIIKQKNKYIRPHKKIGSLEITKASLLDHTNDSYPSISNKNSFLDNFLLRFQGDFDNYEQVVKDRSNGFSPGTGGGHEHIHCTLIPIQLNDCNLLPQEGNEKLLLAVYYMDGNPSRIFRLRMYSLSEEENDDDDDDKDVTTKQQTIVRLKLYSLSGEIQGMLRHVSDQPMKWGSYLQNYLYESSPASMNKQQPFITQLEGCDVVWKIHPHPIRHGYLSQSTTPHPTEDGFHAVMVNEEAVIDSAITLGSKILIKDELSLWIDELWINDRGFNPDTMEFIYGNQRGVPYKMKRVTSLNQGERKIVNENLAWTLGDDFREEKDYLEKMKAIGGVSSKF